MRKKTYSADDFEITGSPTLCKCGRPLHRTIMGGPGDWYVGRWCGCDLDPPRKHFATMREAEDDLFTSDSSR